MFAEAAWGLTGFVADYEFSQNTYATARPAARDSHSFWRRVIVVKRI